ncbi:major facilitator superfamily domain-containing protein [Aspergillus bertholletiae]|uniref:Major facilitator superfamily domain-containing protein n=1 Tax=Aspergillus bertholletiae TaxID=1226010 RepID=A0A5N7B8G1_9EURO|nr:major facilitator superfamily domain-containing protein [Aspergillus bertholletiae]
MTYLSGKVYGIAQVVSNALAAETSFASDCLSEHHLELTPDGRYIRWHRGNPNHPRNWTVARKCFDTGLICLLDFILFLLGQVIGTIVLPPWSETFGRKRLYLISSTLSSACCVVVGVPHSLAAVIIGRGGTGMLAAIPYTVGGGSVEDMWSSQPRIWVMFLWTIASNLGLCVGPIMGTYISVLLNWRWLFYVYASIIGVMSVLFIFIRESRPSLLLTREVDKLNLSTGHSFQALNHDHHPDLRTFLKTALLRPALLFFKEPLVLTISVMVAFAFSLLYIFTEALQPIYETLGFSQTQSSLAFLAIACGIWFSTLTRLLDNKIFDARRRKNLPFRPEDKLIGLAIGAPVLAVSLWWFSWTIPPKVSNTHWIVPSIPLAMMGYALNEFDTVLYCYLGDCYLSYSASATAAVAFLRALLSGVFPLFTKQMFEGLTANVAVSVLAALATAFCIVPPLFIFYGERIRDRSPFAKHSVVIAAELGNKEDDY